MPISTLLVLSAAMLIMAVGLFAFGWGVATLRREVRDARAVRDARRR